MLRASSGLFTHRLFRKLLLLWVTHPALKKYFYYIYVIIGIVSIQLIGAIVWLVIERPDIREIYPYPLTAVLTCRVSTFSLIMSLVYNMILITLCTWYAFKTRKIPENFNEAKYIGFTMYSTCIVWLAFLPIYFGTNNDYKVILVFIPKWNEFLINAFFSDTNC